MLNRAPNVYTPVEPEDNGVALPAVLSLLVHIAILAFIIFFHRAPKIDTPDPIETTIITPEELLNMQADVVSNRQAQLEDINANNIDLGANDSNEADNNNRTTTQKKSDTRTTQTRSISSILTSDNNPINPVDISDPDTNPSSDDFPQDQDPFDLNNTNDANSNDKGIEEGFNSAENDNPINDGKNFDRAALQRNLQKDILNKWNPEVNTSSIVEAVISFNENGVITKISFEYEDTEITKDYLESLDEAIRSVANEKDHFKQAAENDIDSIKLNFKSN